MTRPASDGFSFGPFRYDPGQRLLFRDGEAVALAPKAVDVLHVLIERRGRIVEKAELMSLVWPDTTVEEIGLARNISLLRKALGDDSTEGQYIETIPKRGYRFVPEIQAHEPETTERRRLFFTVLGVAAALALAVLIYRQFYVPSRYLPGGPGMASLAVIPFESLTFEPAHSGFARGLSDLLATELSKPPRVQVLSPSTVSRYQWVGISTSLMARLLGLDVLVEGAVQQISDRLRITARLVDVHTGRVIWGQTYDYPAADRSGAETAITKDIASQVAAHLAGR